MSLLENFIFGLVSGLAEFLPISASAHQALLLKLFGQTDSSNLLQLVIHLALLTALLSRCMSDLTRIRREMRLMRVHKKNRKRQPDMRIVMDRRLLGSAAFLAFIGALLSGLAAWGNMLSITCVMLVICGAVLFIPALFSSGNKDSRHMSRADGWLLGLCGGIGMLPGLSRVGFVLSAAALRGTDRQYACQYALLIGIPALCGSLVSDLLKLFTAGPGTVDILGVLGLAAAFAAAFLGGYISISGMKRLAVKTGYHGFSYYCWGAALLALILHLTIS